MFKFAEYKSSSTPNFGVGDICYTNAETSWDYNCFLDYPCLPSRSKVRVTSIFPDDDAVEILPLVIYDEKSIYYSLLDDESYTDYDEPELYEVVDDIVFTMRNSIYHIETKDLILHQSANLKSHDEEIKEVATNIHTNNRTKSIHDLSELFKERARGFLKKNPSLFLTKSKYPSYPLELNEVERDCEEKNYMTFSNTSSDGSWTIDLNGNYVTF